MSFYFLSFAALKGKVEQHAEHVFHGGVLAANTVISGKKLVHIDGKWRSARVEVRGGGGGDIPVASMDISPGGVLTGDILRSTLKLGLGGLESMGARGAEVRDRGSLKLAVAALGLTRLHHDGGKDQ